MSDAQAKKAQQALALCLAQIRTEDSQTQQATTAGPKAIFQVAREVPAMSAHVLLS